MSVPWCTNPVVSTLKLLGSEEVVDGFVRLSADERVGLEHEERVRRLELLPEFGRGEQPRQGRSVVDFILIR